STHGGRGARGPSGLEILRDRSVALFRERGLRPCSADRFYHPGSGSSAGAFDRTALETLAHARGQFRGDEPDVDGGLLSAGILRLQTAPQTAAGIRPALDPDLALVSPLFDQRHQYFQQYAFGLPLLRRIPGIPALDQSRLDLATLGQRLDGIRPFGLGPAAPHLGPDPSPPAPLVFPPMERDPEIP